MVMRPAHYAIFTLSIWVLSCICAAQNAARLPASSSPQRQAAIALEQQGSLAEAEQAWRSILKTNLDNAEAYAHLGLLAARRENYEQAIPLYRKALSLNPAIPSLRLNLGLALFKGGHPKQAIGEFTQLLNAKNVSPADAYRLRVLIGMAHYGLGEYSEVVPFLKQAAAADPRNLEIRLVLAHSCLWSKQNECVLDTYKEILTIDPDSAEACILAGEAMDAMKNTQGAIEQFRLAIRANPRQPHAHFDLGYLLWIQKQYPEAAGEFQAELAIDPSHAQALAYLGDTEMQMNHPELSTPLLEKAIAIDSSLELPHLDLGILYADAGRNDEALKELKVAAKLDPDDVNVHWRLGRLYRALGKKDEAKAELDMAATLHKATDDSLISRISGSRGRTAEPQTPAAKTPQQ